MIVLAEPLGDSAPLYMGDGLWIDMRPGIIEDLSLIHSEAAVCWDRDGMVDLMPKSWSAGNQCPPARFYSRTCPIMNGETHQIISAANDAKSSPAFQALFDRIDITQDKERLAALARGNEEALEWLRQALILACIGTSSVLRGIFVADPIPRWERF